MVGGSRRGVALLGQKLHVTSVSRVPVLNASHSQTTPRGWRTPLAPPLAGYRCTLRANYSSSRRHGAGRASTWTRDVIFLLAGGAAASLGYAFGVNDAGNHSNELLEREPKAPTYATKAQLELVGGHRTHEEAIKF